MRLLTNNEMMNVSGSDGNYEYPLDSGFSGSSAAFDCSMSIFILDPSGFGGDSASVHQSAAGGQLVPSGSTLFSMASNGDELFLSPDGVSFEVLGQPIPASAATQFHMPSAETNGSGIGAGLGACAGTEGGPVGIAGGGILGGFLGAIIGANWDNIKPRSFPYGNGYGYFSPY